jgi:hypothetical protein
MKCTACGGDLEDGFIPDFGTAQTWVAVWVSGAPDVQKTFWERLRSGGGVRVDGMEAKAIDAKRCVACGHLELYATRSPEPGSTLLDGDR